ncbi:DUF1684 domain-containing protein [Oleiagrimonas sp. C23AA]|uniref:DUF1684 domain-containing protein n=1 Tax=Oleiagrimonas sp. C23AA TaxID=2719047 RepID=UPI00141E3405|nr:DUF1684 domain-containing protein [Oleiagrimonas sp. C23AA]NII09137.1 DUF1684 domain-containing protein [Oleiagrimonas sp. C23AA]
MFRHRLLIAATLFGVVTCVSAADTSSYTHSIEAWRHARVQRLTAPHGWLSLVALDWLSPGANTVGSAKDNAIVIDKAPAHLGTIDWRKDGSVQLTLAGDAKGVTIDGKHEHEATLRDDSHAKPTTVAFGTVGFYLIDRDGRKGLRVKDTQAPTRKHFLGIDYFPIDPSWRVVAKWVPFDPPRTLEMGSVIGTVDKVPVPGKAVFTRDGHTYTLYPIIEAPGDEQYFLVFADATSGKETYGAARFIYVDKPQNGHVVIDFNKAYNPPCAFTSFATCPLAPPENRLDLRVTAGEKKYRGHEE